MDKKTTVKKQTRTKKAVSAKVKALSIEDRADEILKLAEASDMEDNFYFITTFKRYMMQIKILDDLEKEIENSDSVLVTKKYVRGSSNTYTHPAIKEYNRTTDSANRTCAILLKIISGGKEKNPEEIDPLIQIINGRSKK